MRVFTTTDAPPTGATEQLHIYNGLDCCVTLEVLEAILPQLDEVTQRVYNFERSLQGPVLEMQCRGFAIDTVGRAQVLGELTAVHNQLNASLSEILKEGVGVEINPASPQQLAYLFYDVLGLPVIKSFKTRAPTTDRKALEKLRSYFFAGPLVNHILAIRDVAKKISVVKTGIDFDNRMRTTFSIAGTTTGRFSSYQSVSGSGTNLQNITDEMRKMFVADPGYKLGYIDLEQAESRAVGAIEWNLFHDGKYLDACESGDLHTSVCRMCWDHLGWTGDPKLDKAIAKQPFYRHFDYRDASKRLGHASNYYGQPPHIAKEVHIEHALVADFQKKYFKAFPSHQEWHAWVRNKLGKDGFITTFLGRRRAFFGRRWEDETLRGAIAYEPQSVIGDYINTGLLRVWRSGLVQLLVQVHDALVFQYPEEKENEIIPQVQALLEIEVPLLHGRSLTISTEAMVGWNWGKAHVEGALVNPNGLVPFTGNDQRKRKKTSILD